MFIEGQRKKSGVLEDSQTIRLEPSACLNRDQQTKIVNKEGEKNQSDFLNCFSFYLL